MSLDDALDRLQESVLLMLIVALPSFMNLSSARVFEEEKAMLLRAGATLILCFGVITGFRSWRDASVWRHSIVVAVLTLTTAICIASITSIDPARSWWGAYVRSHGTVTWLGLVVLFLAAAFTAKRPASRERLIIAVAMGTVGPALYALTQYAGADPIDWSWLLPGRAGSTLGNPILLGGYLAAVAPITVAQMFRRRTPALWWGALLVLQLAALLATGSRGPLLGVLVGTAFAAVLSAVLVVARQPHRGALLSAMLLTVGIAVVGVIAARGASDAAALVARTFNVSSGSGRVRMLIWEGAVEAIGADRVRMAIGYGPESFRAVYLQHYRPELVHVEQGEALPDRAHNDVLDTAISTGLVGTASLLAVYVAVLLTGLRRLALIRSRTSAISVAGLALGGAIIGSLIAFVSDHSAVAGAAALAGLLIGVTIFLLISTAFAPQDQASPEDAALIIGSMVAVVVHMAELQTGIATVVSRMVMLVAAALIAVPSESGGADREVQNRPRSAQIAVVALLAAAVAAPFGVAALQTIVSLPASALLYGSLLSIVIGLSTLLAKIDVPFRAAPRSTGRVSTLMAVLFAVATVSTTTQPALRADESCQRATMLERAGRWDDAVAAYREAVRNAPSVAVYLTGLGRSLVATAETAKGAARLRALEQAASALERAATLEPLEPDHQRNLARLHQRWSSLQDDAERERQLELADAAFKRATRLAPRLPAVWIEWATSDVERQRFAEAARKLDRVEALDAHAVNLWVVRAHVRAAATDLDGALAAFDRALEDDERSVLALRGRAALLIALGRREEAGRAIARLVQQSPDDPVAERLKREAARLWP